MILAPPAKTRLTAAEYFAAYPETMSRQELIHGEVLPLASPNRTHQVILARLHHRLDDFISQHQLGAVDLAPLDVTLDEENVVQPDIFFVSKANPHCHLGADDRWYGAPDLCIEILSSNIRHDRVKKMQLYARYGVQEYWIVDPVGRYVEIHTLEGERLVFQSDFGETETLTSQLLPDLALKLAEIFPAPPPAI